MENKIENMLEVTSYEVLGKLPDLFQMDDGTRLTNPADWEKRRAEIYKTAVELQYGTMPPEPGFLEVETLYDSAKTKSFRIITGTKAHPISFRMQVLPPKGKKSGFPIIVDGDGCFKYTTQTGYVDAALDKGIGWALFDRTELAHDIQYEGRRKGDLYEVYPEYTFGALGAWAWGYSRCVDALLKLGLVDPEWIIFSGHSRGAKTAMLAGVLDTRATIVNPNETCAGGCACYRIHMSAKTLAGEDKPSETLANLIDKFGFWMGEGMQDYTERENELPFDSHFLKAMIAPRTLFVSEAAHDPWSNPIGSWMTTMAAGELFKFLGKEDNLYWYFRDGAHAHLPQDVEMLVSLINHKRKGTPLHEDFFRRPFEEKEFIF